MPSRPFAHREFSAVKNLETRMCIHCHQIRDAERVLFAEDIARGRPDVILVESATLRAWAGKQPELAHVLDGFRKAAVASEIEVWTRGSAQ